MAREIALGQLVRVLDPWTAGGANISVLVPHKRGQLAGVQATIEHIVRELPEARSLR
jgi:ACT domain-containing protein